MRRHVAIALNRVNLPRIVCSHMFGDDHSHRHRMSVGACVMICGVYVAKTAGHIHFEPLAAAGDLLGYLIHGIGAVPYVDALMLLQKPQDGQHTEQ